MRFFCFKLIKAEYDLRKKIDGLISSDEPDIDIFGIKRWNKGLHFTGNDVYIDGFYLNEYWNKVRGFPVRSRFRGRFTVNKTGSMEFRGWLYPAFPEFTFLVCLFLLQLISLLRVTVYL